MPPRARAKKRYHHQDLPGALLREASTVLAKTGSADFTLRSLARGIGVSHAAPYAHFTTKNALLAAIARNGFQRLDVQMRAAADASTSATARARLLQLGRAYIEFGLENPALYHLMFGAELAAESHAHPEFIVAARTAFATLVAHVQAVHPADDGKRAVAAWAMVHGGTLLLLEGHTDNLRFGKDDIITTLLNVAVDGIEAA